MEQSRELMKSNLSVTKVLEIASVFCSPKLMQIHLGLRQVFDLI